jgi:hypothetical protein
MKEYKNSKDAVKDYQPSEKQFAGKQFGKANDYMARKDKQMNSDAAKIRSEAYKGRYE